VKVRRLGTPTASIGLVAVLASLLLATASPAMARQASAAQCPLVNPTTGAVSPAPAPGVDWVSCNLLNSDLRFADLSSADLDGANLSGADMNTVNLSNASLQGADLQGSYMVSSNLSGSDLTSANLTGSVLSRSNVDGANLADAQLTGVDGPYLTGTPLNLPSPWIYFGGSLIGPYASVWGADLNGADLAAADLTGVNSGQNTGTPASLPAHWLLAGGYLIGPTADLYAATLSGLNLTGADMSGVTATKAYLQGTNLTGANLTGADFSSTQAENADLQNAYAAKSSFLDSNLTGDNLDGADFTSVNLEGADLANATTAGATFSGDTWYYTVCPDGTSSNNHVAGCFSPLDRPQAAPAVTAGVPGLNGWYTSPVTVTWKWSDAYSMVASQCPSTSTTSGSGNPVALNATCTDVYGNQGSATYAVKVDLTRPAVSVTGVRDGRQYVLGRVPARGCRTAETVSGVAKPATLHMTTTGFRGMGPFSATCAGAVSVAGISQAQAARVTYAVVAGFGGFIAPASGQAMAGTAPSIKVRFRLVVAAGKTITGPLGASLGARHDIRATLAGPGIKPARATCRWLATARDFACKIRVPQGVKTGRSHAYYLTAQENVGTGFIAVPAVDNHVSREKILFR
jgi:uncharacterized protein YjbI with pentapeptide repeats